MTKFRYAYDSMHPRVQTIVREITEWCNTDPEMQKRLRNKKVNRYIIAKLVSYQFEWVKKNIATENPYESIAVSLKNLGTFALNDFSLNKKYKHAIKKFKS